MKTAITVEIDTECLEHFTDEHIATLWHVAQVNPAPIDDADAGHLAEMIGREIIRRWLERQRPVLWHHQGKHHFATALCQFARWDGKNWLPRKDGMSAAEAKQVTP